MNLTVNKVTKRYKDKLALSNINIEFKPGIWGLLGPNGAGKTTLMQILVGIKDPSSGNVSMNGVEIGKMDKEYRKILGFLPQKFGGYEDLSVGSYLKYVSCLKGVAKSRTDDKIDELLSALNLYEVKNKKIRKLSGGMKQRVGIAQTMLNNPKVLVLDEPTAGLDIEERRRFREYLVKNNADRITIISTHIISDIELISNDIVILIGGKIINCGNTETLKHEMDGYVWEAVIPTKYLEQVKTELSLTNYHNVTDNEILIRYVSEEKVLKNSQSVEPELSDYYLFINQKENI